MKNNFIILYYIMSEINKKYGNPNPWRNFTNAFGKIKFKFNF